MKHQNRTRAVDTFPTISVGQKIHLNLDTPDGLFEADNGNKYIVTRDHNTKVAVALVHSRRQSFTWRRLRRKSSVIGRWRGPYALRLTHALGDSVFPLTPGFISISGCYAGVDCWERDGQMGCIALGDVGDAGSFFCDFDGWELVALHTGRVFYEHSPAKNTLITLCPTHPAGT